MIEPLTAVGVGARIWWVMPGAARRQRHRLIDVLFHLRGDLRNAADGDVEVIVHAALRELGKDLGTPLFIDILVRAQSVVSRANENADSAGVTAARACLNEAVAEAWKQVLVNDPVLRITRGLRESMEMLRIQRVLVAVEVRVAGAAGGHPTLGPPTG